MWLDGEKDKEKDRQKDRAKEEKHKCQQKMWKTEKNGKKMWNENWLV